MASAASKKAKAEANASSARNSKSGGSSSSSSSSYVAPTSNYDPYAPTNPLDMPGARGITGTYNTPTPIVPSAPVIPPGTVPLAPGVPAGPATPVPPIGTTAYTNWLLGGQYFDENTYMQTQPFVPTPETIQRGIAGLSAEDPTRNKTYQGGELMPARNADGSLASTVMPTGNIGTAPVKVPTTPTGNTTADAVAAGAEETLASVEEYIALLTPPETKESKTAKDLAAQISADLESLKGRGAAQLKEEEKQQVEQKKQTLQNYQAELAQRLAEYKAIQAKYQALNADVEGKPVTMNSIIGAQAQVNRVMQAEMNVKASEIAMVQANISGAQGNLTLAQESADRAVDLRYQDTLDAINIRQQQLALLQGELDKKDKIRADAIQLYLQDQKNKLATQIANEKDKNATLLNQMQNYPDAGITLNDTIESANQKITQNSKIYKEKIRGPVGDNDFPGYSGTDVVAIKNDIKAHGLDAVLAGITDPKQVKAITDLASDVKTEEKEATKLTRTSISSLYGIPDNEDRSGFLGFGKTNKAKLDEIMKTIAQYQAVGTSDADILKLIQQ